jgi:hypothetical protein
MSAWTSFVKKIFMEGKKKNPAFQFKDAMKEASKRKSEMGATTKKARTSKKGGKRGKSRRKRR